MMNSGRKNFLSLGFFDGSFIALALLRAVYLLGGELQDRRSRELKCPSSPFSFF